MFDSVFELVLIINTLKQEGTMLRTQTEIKELAHFVQKKFEDEFILETIRDRAKQSNFVCINASGVQNSIISEVVRDRAKPSEFSTLCRVIQKQTSMLSRKP